MQTSNLVTSYEIDIFQEKWSNEQGKRKIDTRGLSKNQLEFLSTIAYHFCAYATQMNSSKNRTSPNSEA